MSVTIYYTETKSDDVKQSINNVNEDPNMDWEFIPVDDEWGITDEEYLVHLDSKKVLLAPKDEPKWPAPSPEAGKRASLSGWIHYPRIPNQLKDIGSIVIMWVDEAIYQYE